MIPKCALDALLLQIAEPFGEQLERPFRIQIFEALRCRTVSFDQFSRSERLFGHAWAKCFSL
jgi:hypothetical protein